MSYWKGNWGLAGVPESVIFQQCTYYYGLRLDVFANNGAEDSPLSKAFRKQLHIIGLPIQWSTTLSSDTPILRSMQKPINMSQKASPQKLLLNPYSFTETGRLETGRLDTSVLRWWNEVSTILSHCPCSPPTPTVKVRCKDNAHHVNASATYIHIESSSNHSTSPPKNQR